MPVTLTADERRARIDRLRRFPDELEVLVNGLNDDALFTAFIPHEWSVAQNVHHLADAHMNGYIRMHLVLTEDKPPLKAYAQAEWAKLADYSLPIASSLALLRNLHARWCALLGSLKTDDFARVGIHSEAGEVNLDDLLNTYTNHCNAHIEQITRTLAAGRS